MPGTCLGDSSACRFATTAGYMRMLFVVCYTPMIVQNVRTPLMFTRLPRGYVAVLRNP
jgi:hypothetical protein